jgi:hypothetical protein
VDKPRVFADLQGADPLGRVRLTSVGTMRDLARHGIQLRDGLVLTLYDDEFEFDGRVVYAPEERGWVAEIDWHRIWEAAGMDPPPWHPSAVRGSA